MDVLFRAIDNNPFRKECVSPFTKEKEELRRLEPKENLWGGGIRGLTPARLQTAWLVAEDPLMIIAGHGYRATEVRDKTFALQEEALSNIRGNRKLSKVKMSDALAALRPTQDHAKVVAAVLLALKHIQTVCFDEAEKTVWTMPEDLRAWDAGLKTLWVDTRCEKMLEWGNGVAEPAMGRWLAEREEEGWKIGWPVADGSFEEIKARMGELGLTPRAPLGEKLKKEHWAAALGRAEAIRHLGVAAKSPT
jgi:hypothetical protein